MPLNLFLRKKCALLRDAGVKDDSTLIYLYWDTLDKYIKISIAVKNGES